MFPYNFAKFVNASNGPPGALNRCKLPIIGRLLGPFKTFTIVSFPLSSSFSISLSFVPSSWKLAPLLLLVVFNNTKFLFDLLVSFWSTIKIVTQEQRNQKTASVMISGQGRVPSSPRITSYTRSRSFFLSFSMARNISRRSSSSSALFLWSFLVFRLAEDSPKTLLYSLDACCTITSRSESAFGKARIPLEIPPCREVFFAYNHTHLSLYSLLRLSSTPSPRCIVFFSPPAQPKDWPSTRIITERRRYFRRGSDPIDSSDSSCWRCVFSRKSRESKEVKKNRVKEMGEKLSREGKKNKKKEEGGRTNDRSE